MFQKKEIKVEMATISFRVTPEQKNQIIEMAIKKYGVTPSEFIRAKILLNQQKFAEWIVDCVNNQDSSVFRK